MDAEQTDIRATFFKNACDIAPDIFYRQYISKRYPVKLNGLLNDKQWQELDTSLNGILKIFQQCPDTALTIPNDFTVRVEQRQNTKLMIVMVNVMEMN